MLPTLPRPARPIHSVRKAAFFRPIIRAYLFGHLTSTGPRLLSALLSLYTKYRNPKHVMSKLTAIILKSLGTDRFPYFCGHLVAVFVALRAVLTSAVSRSRIQDPQQIRLLLHLSTFLSAATASWLSLPLLNGLSPSPSTSSYPSVSSTSTVHLSPSSIPTTPSTPSQTQQAGKTLDLTLLAAVRATETLLFHLWRLYRRHPRSPLRHRLESALASAADPALFIASAGTVMWAWFYEPSRVPHGYNRWITSAAQVDPRLINVLRAARAGTFQYGIDQPGAAHILTPMCEDHDWPRAWGDPAVTIPVPCEMVHQGLARSCHVAAARRFARAFRFAFVMYFPLQVVLRLRTHPLRATVRKLAAALRESTRSAAFLGTFIGLFYYAVCLARTVLGPRLVSRATISAQDWDSGLCVAAGCASCGWSVLLEPARRRQELAGFVAPRALATCLPRRYQGDKFWRERAGFSVSFGVLAAAVRESPEGVRGVLGGLLAGVLN